MNKNRLFEITLRVHRTKSTQMHPRFGGAQIMAYAICRSEEAALSQVCEELVSEGYDLLDEPPRIRELLPESWNQYVNELLPGLRSRLPSQEELLSFMANERLFFGSFYPFE